MAAGDVKLKGRVGLKIKIIPGTFDSLSNPFQNSIEMGALMRLKS